MQVIEKSDNKPKLKSLDTLFIQTYGCAMNVYDSSRMSDLMQSAYGLRIVDEPADADVILMNTCSIRENAENKVYSELGRYKKIKDKRPDLIIGVGGCVGQQEGDRIQKRAPYVDIVFGPQTYHRLPEMVKEIRRDRVRVTEIDMPEIEKFDHLPKPKVEGLTGYVTIMEGCDKFCTFCIVPYTRGAEISRPVADILEECEQLIEAGAKDISLLGQNVNAYRVEDEDGEEVGFAELLHLVGALEGMERLRFSTSHPMEMTTELCEAFAEIPTLMPYLHLPVQSGSDDILKAMHRGHKREDYFKAIDELRLFTPDIALSSDFIVGFPGETDEDFEQTLDLVRKVGYDSAFSFKYSPRPGTPAAKAEDDVPEDVKDERLQRLLALLRGQSRERMEQQVGKTLDVLIEGKSKNDGDLRGRTPDFRIVHFQGNLRLIGQTLPIKVTEAYNMSLRGELIIEAKIKEPVLFDCSEMEASKLSLFCGADNQNIKKIEDTFKVTLRGQMGKWFILGEQAESAVLALDELKQQIKNGDLEKQGVEDMLREFRSGGMTEETYDDKMNAIVLSAGRRNIQGKTPNQRKYLQSIADKTLTIGVGPAGCGKTYLAVAHAVVALQSQQVEKIILTRPAVEAGENLGFLPGDLQQKVDPYLRPLFDALSDMIGADKMAAMMEQGVIEIAPLAYMRGRTLNDAFVILDEAQNTTKAQMKMFLTRLGFGSKMVVTGDITQVDLPNIKDSGLLHTLKVLKGVKDIGICELSSEDVIRHRLVEQIVQAYDKHD